MLPHLTTTTKEKLQLLSKRIDYLASHQMSSLKATLKRSGLVGIGPRMAKLCHLAKTAVALRRRFATEEETFRQGLFSTKSFLCNV